MSPSSSSGLGRMKFVTKNAEPDGIVMVTKDTKVIIGGESNLEDLPKEESLIVSKSTLDEIQRELTESVEKAFEDAKNKMKQRGIEVEKSEHAPSKIVVKDSDIEIVRKE